MSKPIIRLNTIHEDGARATLFSSDDLSNVLEWSRFLNNIALTKMLEDMKRFQDQGGELSPHKTALAPGLEIEILYE